jgi:type VII secretion protein EccB
MQTRRDQVQAHSFVAGRLVSAMVRAEPDAPTTPLRRFTVGAFVGLMAGLVLIAGFGIFGYIKPGGSKAFRAHGALIVEKETGTQYVFVDGELTPVLNFASAKLILGNDLRVVSASRNSLKGLPHTLPVGIPSAPDALPKPGDLDAVDWQVCSALKPDVSGEDQPFVSVRIGAPPAAAPLGDAEALIVATADGARYLAWRGRRLRIPDAATLGALGYGSARQHQVGPAWINALPAGPDLKAPAMPGRGKPGPAIGGRPTRAGQLFEVHGAGTQPQHFLLTRDGLAPLTPTGAALVLGSAAAKAAYPNGRVTALRLDPAALAAAPRADRALLDPGLPPAPPVALSDTADAVPCLQVTVGGDTGAQVRIALSGAGGAPQDAGKAAARAAPAALGASLRSSVGDGSGQPSGPARPVNPAPELPTGPIAPGSPGGPTGGARGGLADKVTVAPGAGLLIRDLPAPGVADGAWCLLVDTGYRYPLPDDNIAATLGYGNVAAVPVPTTLLSLIPAGRPLDPEAAKKTQPVTPQAAQN